MRYFFWFYFFNILVFGQEQKYWYPFYVSDTINNPLSESVGFKDYKGSIEIKPIYASHLTPNKRFERIVALGQYQKSHFYINKQGKKFGIDSLFSYDNMYDCESEGFIRFHNHKADKVGMFNTNGKISISDEYNYLSSVINGMVIALKGAEKKIYENGEHFEWVGGKHLLIDTNNNVLLEIENIKDFYNLNLFSIEKGKKPSENLVRKSFLAKDGNYISFIDFELEFINWLKKELLVNLTRENLLQNSYESIYWYSNHKNKKWSKEKYLNKNFEIVKTELNRILDSKTDYFISIGGLYGLDSNEEKLFDKYFDNCGNLNENKYPSISIIINNRNNNDLYQNHLEFLRTEYGYKLIRVIIN